MNSMRNPFRLENEIALITGGGTGLGLGIAHCFVEAGARVVLVGRREPELSQAAMALGKNAFGMPHDVTEVDRAHELMERAAQTAGGWLLGARATKLDVYLRHMRDALDPHRIMNPGTLG